MADGVNKYVKLEEAKDDENSLVEKQVTRLRRPDLALKSFPASRKNLLAFANAQSLAPGSADPPAPDTLHVSAKTIERQVATSKELRAVSKPSATHLPVQLHFAEQHTVSWEHALMGEESADGENDLLFDLPPGECNLYQFPHVKIASSGADIVLSGSQLECLKALIRGLASSGSSSSSTDPMLVPDSSGAFVLHGLLIANTDAAVSLAIDLLSIRPALLPQSHADGPFVGENALHVLAVNQRQPEATRVLELAVKHLSDAAISSLLLSMARGPFFKLEPMRSYGGSPLAYLCAFRATVVLQHIFSDVRLPSLIDLNSLAIACPISGYLPLHAAVANGRTEV